MTGGPYGPYVPQSIGEIMDQLAMMMLKSPTFHDDYFIGRNVDSVFFELNEGLKAVRKNWAKSVTKHWSLYLAGCERILRRIRRTRPMTRSRGEN